MRYPSPSRTNPFGEEDRTEKAVSHDDAIFFPSSKKKHARRLFKPMTPGPMAPGPRGAFVSERESLWGPIQTSAWGHHSSIPSPGLWRSVHSTARDDISSLFFFSVEFFQREMMRLRLFSRKRVYKYHATAGGAVFFSPRCYPWLALQLPPRCPP